MTHAKATFGIFSSREHLDRALDRLRQIGFGESSATILFPDKEGATDFPHVQKSELVKFVRLGTLLGAVLFLIFGNLAASGIIPLQMLSNASVFDRVVFMFACVFLGAIIGSACGSLVGIGTPDRAGRRYGQYVNAGGILLSVHSESVAQQKKIAAALEDSGAYDIAAVDEDVAWAEVLDEKGHLEKVDLSRNSLPAGI